MDQLLFLSSLGYLAAAGALLALGLLRLIRLPVQPVEKEHFREQESELPRILVQVPLFNEGEACRPLLRALAEQTYPAELVHIQILDDSTDGSQRLTEAIARLELKATLSWELLHRQDRQGFKAGALKAGLFATHQPLVAMFDADFRPPAEFLETSVNALLAHPAWACVQSPWGHLNRDANLLTRAQALALEGHFFGQQLGRFQRGGPVTFNGTAGVWRRQAIEEADGWRGDTLTEDMDLSIRVHLAGWDIGFLPHQVVPAELPESWPGFLSQQKRWCRGGWQVFRLLARPVLASRSLSVLKKRDIIFQLTENMAYPLLFLLMVLSVPAFAFGPWDLKPWAAGLGAAALASFWIYHGLLGRRQGRRAGALLVDLVLVSLTAIALAPHQTLATLQGLFGGPGVFLRTPKAAGPPVPRQKRSGVWVLLGLVFVGATGLLLWHLLPWIGYWGVPFFLLYALGLTWPAWFPRKPAPEPPCTFQPEAAGDS